ncbi:MAG: Cys-tRNA(Pro) deacylase [Gammaproteobacteria bacterium]
MTPAVTAARKAGISIAIHEYEHDPKARSFGLEAAEKLGFDPARVFKTLVVETAEGKLAVGIVPVACQLDMKAMARALGTRKAAMAERAAAERATGYVMGGISPLGQKKRLAMVLDESAFAHPTVYVSGGRRGLDIEIAPGDLCQLTGAQRAAIAET